MAPAQDPKETQDLDPNLGSGPGDMEQARPEEARDHSIQRLIQSMMHACDCHDDNCTLPYCLKMKRIVTHTKACQQGVKGGCSICKSLISLCCYHVKRCNDMHCSVLYCSSIKQKHPDEQDELLPLRMRRRTGMQEMQLLLRKHQKELQWVYAALRAPNNHQQQQKILQILRTNPILWNAFVRQPPRNRCRN